MADISFGKEGGLRLKVLRDHPRMKQLRTALKKLESIPALTLMADSVTIVDGQRTNVYRPIDVKPGDPDFGLAVGAHLNSQYGFLYTVGAPSLPPGQR